MSLPVSIHPDRVAACFRAAGSSAVAATLLQEPRFADRLVELVARHYDLGSKAESLREPDSVIAALDLDGLEALSFRAGIVVNSRAFVQEIRGPVLAKLSERFGVEAMDESRAHLDLAGQRPALADIDALENAVRMDGQACLAAWIAALPVSLAQVVRLKWASDAAVPTTADPDILRRGPDIIQRLAGHAEPQT